MSKVKIENIELKLGKQKIVLSIDQAKELKNILNETFGDKEKEYIRYPVYIQHWATYWPYQTGGTTCTTAGNDSSNFSGSTLYLEAK